MPYLVNPHDLFARAYKEHWALGAFNTNNLESTQAIAWALRDAHAPGILQTSETALEYAGLPLLRDLIRNVADSVDVPILLHLDHGKSYDIAARCIEAGYPSVMIDGSALPLDENIALTKRVVELARTKHVWVEGEVGAILGKEGMRDGKFSSQDSLFTTPEDAKRFVTETGVNALAVSVGTIHGAFRGEEKIHFDVLESIYHAVSIPLVLHGASGLPADNIRQSLQYGVTKVNIDTELREAFHDALMSHTEEDPKHSVDPRAMMKPARDAMQKIVAEKIALLGSAQRAQ